jgi:hypothetical protein
MWEVVLLEGLSYLYVSLFLLFCITFTVAGLLIFPLLHMAPRLFVLSHRRILLTIDYCFVLIFFQQLIIIVSVYHLIIYILKNSTKF